MCSGRVQISSHTKVITMASRRRTLSIILSLLVFLQITHHSLAQDKLVELNKEPPPRPPGEFIGIHLPPLDQQPPYTQTEATATTQPQTQAQTSARITEGRTQHKPVAAPTQLSSTRVIQEKTPVASTPDRATNQTPTLAFLPGEVSPTWARPEMQSGEPPVLFPHLTRKPRPITSSPNILFPASNRTPHTPKPSQPDAVSNTRPPSMPPKITVEATVSQPDPDVPWHLNEKNMKWYLIGISLFVLLVMVIVITLVVHVLKRRKKKEKVQVRKRRGQGQCSNEIYSGSSSCVDHRFSFPTTDGPTGYTDIRPCTPLAKLWRSRGYSVSSQRSGNNSASAENSFGTLRSNATTTTVTPPPPLPPKPSSPTRPLSSASHTHNGICAHTMQATNNVCPHHSEPHTYCNSGLAVQGVITPRRKPCFTGGGVCMRHAQPVSTDSTPCSTLRKHVHQSPNRPLRYSNHLYSPPHTHCGACHVTTQIHPLDRQVLKTIRSSEVLETTCSSQLIAALEHAHRLACVLTPSEINPAHTMHVVANRHAQIIDDSDDSHSSGYIGSQGDQGSPNSNISNSPPNKPLPPLPCHASSAEEGLQMSTGQRLRRGIPPQRHQKRQRIPANRKSTDFVGRSEQVTDSGLYNETASVTDHSQQERVEQPGHLNYVRTTEL